MGKLSWKYNPLNNTKVQDYNAYSPVAALQVGAEYKITPKILLGIHAKYYISDYETSLRPTNSTQTLINHSNGQSLSVGFRFLFGDSAPKSTLIEKKEIELIPEVVIEEKPLKVEKVMQEPTPIIPPVVIGEKDSDGDGVLDFNDKCSNTPDGFSVSEDGCEKAYNLKINFASNSDKIETEYEATIAKFANFLKSFPKYKANIEAHSDSSGNAKKNQILSQKRAKSVYDSLLNHGIDKDRLTYEGMGEAVPLVSNDTKEGRAKNRRIEVVLLKQELIAQVKE